MNILGRIIMGIALLVFAGKVSAQSPQNQLVDSLLFELRKEKVDSLKVDLYDKLAYEVMYNDPLQGLSYARKGVKIAEENGYTEQLGALFDKISVGEYILGNYDSAMSACRKSLQINEQENDVSSVQNNLNSMGAIFNAIDNHEKALEYFYESLKLGKKLGLKKDLITLYINIAEIKLDEGDFAEALECVNKSLDISMQFKDSSGIGQAYFTLADHFSTHHQYDSALAYAYKALHFHQPEGRSEDVAKTHTLMASIYANMGMIDSCIVQAETAMGIARQISQAHVIRELYKVFSYAYKERNDYEKAYAYQKSFFELNDSLTMSKVRKQIVFMEAEYKLQKKNNLIESMVKEDKIKELKLQKKNMFIYILSAVFLVIIFIGVVLYMNYKLSKESKIVSLESKLLRSQMNPHFIFNALMAIQCFALEQNSKEVGNYLTKFADLMRLILNNSRVDMVTLEKELEVLENYLELQVLRYDHKFTYRITTDEDLNTTLLMIPPMLIQPFVENAIEHGLASMKTDGEIQINIHKENEFVKILVVDNGIGIQKSTSIKSTRKDHASLATQIIEERLHTFNQKRKAKASLSIQDAGIKEKRTGTKVTLKLPLVWYTPDSRKFQLKQS